MFFHDLLTGIGVELSELREPLLWGIFFLTAFIYGRYRSRWWRKILSASLNYHRFHLASIQGDRGIDEKTREYATALLWAINKQLPSDVESGGGKSLWMSFLGGKTSLNTCGAIFYESARFMRFIDLRIVKLNDTLLSTFYRILFLESLFFPAAVFFMDIRFLVSLFVKPESGAQRLYIEMRKDI